VKRKPRALVIGNTVGVVAPSGVVKKDSLDRGVAILERLGYRVRVYPSTLDRYGYLAGQDRDRARDFTDAWKDPDVHAVIAARGGYGATRMMRYLDFEALRPHKKIFVGYSDITALHSALWRKLRLVTFHGPMVSTSHGTGLEVPYNLTGLADAVTGARYPGPLALPPEAKIAVLSGGRAEGDLIGGNLSLVAASIGTDYEVMPKGKILFLEEVGEAPYRIDRMLCQLESAGKLDEAAGFLLGDFTDCEAKEGVSTLTLDEILSRYLTGKGKPCIAGVPAGHGRFNAILPMGVRTAIDGEEGSVTFLERTVIQ